MSTAALSPGADGPAAPVAGGRPLLRQVLRERRRPAVVSTLGGVVHQTCEAFVPVLIGVLVDRAIERRDAGELVLWIVVLALLFAVLTTAYRVQLLTLVGGLEHGEHDLRTALARRILAAAGIAAPPRPGAVRSDVGGSAGAQVTVAGSDARRTVDVLEAVSVGGAAIAAIVVTAAVLLATSLPLGLLVLLGTPPLLYALQLLARPLERRSGVDQARAAEAAGVATDLASGLRVLKGIGAERAGAERYRVASRRALDAAVRAGVAQNLLLGANVLISGAFLAVVAWVGGRLALDGTISIGELVAAVGLTQFLVGPLQRLAFASTLLAESRAAADRVSALLDAAPDRDDPRSADHDDAPPPRSAVALAVAPTAAGTPALDVAPGEHLGVATADPAVSTALVHLLAHRGEAPPGALRVDGAPTSDLALDAARGLVLVADHDAALFSGTVRDNVLAAAAAGLDLDAVLDASGADEAVRAIPGGLDGQVGERGRSLSGGQRQRVALARALAAAPPVLVLHEPTTAVDAVTEARIASGVRRLRDGRTTVVVATSPSLLAACDRVVLLGGDGVLAEGTHAELVEREDAYRAAVLS
ncbi:ABC transporter ATP-binding protein [Patulibacter sp.]|uniref:ABC transporter transmembrane domain-containing protein n=1 Tax=Patulibacter sp. TaxID=1912859 RepID=UPI0027277EB0|nr:ABC transporter ATP-binding protein [Patulibacter sp.]MDO9407842.1 ABC transporter ATP-binding protein [Patulibacter sp.]